jgi:membrane fusion protein (multidrug efflux system)
MAVVSAAESPIARTRKPSLPSRTVVKRTVLGLGLLAGAAVAADYGTSYWTVGRYLQSTDDAYVKADYTTVAPKISGYVTEVLVADNARVKAGQVLARIDDRDFRAALDQARAEVATADAAIRNLDAQIALQRSAIDEAAANVAAAEATLKFADSEFARYQALLKTGYGTAQRAEQADAARAAQAATLQRDRAALAGARKKIDVLATARAKAQAERDRSRAAERQAGLNLSYTTITAPVNGTVGARSLRVGQYVQAGTQLMAVVPLHAVYVVANFKETQLTHIRNGQPVTIEVDGFPAAKLTGHVDSLSPASGLEFALLPPDNATGNFTKIVQRIPVKIALDDTPLTGLLRSGMSVEPTVDTKATVLAEGDQPRSPDRLVATANADPQPF